MVGYLPGRLEWGKDNTPPLIRENSKVFQDADASGLVINILPYYSIYTSSFEKFWRGHLQNVVELKWNDPISSAPELFLLNIVVPVSLHRVSPTDALLSRYLNVHNLLYVTRYLRHHHHTSVLRSGCVHLGNHAH